VTILIVCITSYFCVLYCLSPGALRDLHSFPTRRSSDLTLTWKFRWNPWAGSRRHRPASVPRAGSCRTMRPAGRSPAPALAKQARSEEHTSELQSRENLVCRLLLEKKKKKPQKLSAS